MALNPVIPDNSYSSNLNQVNDMVRQLNNEAQTKVFKGPNNVNSLITGKLPNDLGYGMQFSDSDGVPRIIAYIDANNNPILKISESGVNVTTATDTQLTFNSAQNVLKVHSTGTVTLTTSGVSPRVASTVIAHNLGYSPIIIGSIKLPSGLSNEVMAFPLAYITTGSPFRTRVVAEYFATDLNNATLQVKEDIATGDYVIKYYVLTESGAS